MEAQENGRMPLLFAMSGALLALGSLLLPWFTLDMVAFEGYMKQLLTSMVNEMGALPGGELADAATVQQQVNQGWAVARGEVERRVAEELLGWKANSAWGLFSIVVGSLGALGTAARCWTGDQTPKEASVRLGLFTGMIIYRPVWGLISPPGPKASDFAQLTQFGAPAPPDGMLSAGFGLWVALAACALLAFAAYRLESMPEEAKVPYVDLSAPAPAYGGVHVPVPANAAPQPQQAYVPPQPQQAYAPPQQQSTPPPSGPYYQPPPT